MAGAEHFFEDHSQMFVQYGWRDMLWGIEAHLPRNPFVDGVVVEYLKTDDQTGGLYHDKNDLVPEQISGKDNYYYHHVYGAWQHWGQCMGNPIILSPIYNDNHEIEPYHSRVRSFHVGLEGTPADDLHYRLLFTHLMSLGTYDKPCIDSEYQNYFMAELTYSPQAECLRGWAVTGAYGYNRGDLISNSTGLSLSISKTGKLF